MAVPINGYYAPGEVNLVDSEHELLCTEDDEAVISTSVNVQFCSIVCPIWKTKRKKERKKGETFEWREVVRVGRPGANNLQSERW